MSETPFAIGRRLCGEVRFPISAHPIGGQTAGNASIAASGNIDTRHFRPKRGSRLLGENSSHPEVVNNAVGCVDDDDWFVPGRVVYAKDRPTWDGTAAEVPNFDRMPL